MLGRGKRSTVQRAYSILEPEILVDDYEPCDSTYDITLPVC
jgi:hypothetical protein